MLKDGMFVGMVLEDVEMVLDGMGLTYEEVWEEDDLEGADFGILVDTYEILFTYSDDSEYVCVQSQD